jgi:hypothetical protein
MNGWTLFALIMVMGLADLALGIRSLRKAGTAVEHEFSTATYDASPRAFRIRGYAMIVSAFLMWGLAAAFAAGLLGTEFALPVFAEAAS